MLNHRDPAVGCGFLVFLFVLVNCRKVHLLEFFCVGIDCRAGKGRHPREHIPGAFPFRRVAIAKKLIICRGCNRFRRLVFHLLSDIDDIATTFEHERLGNRDARIVIIGQRNLNRVSGSQVGLCYASFPNAGVVGKPLTRKSGLCHKVSAHLVLHQRKWLARVATSGVLKQRNLPNVAAQRVNLNQHGVGTDANALASSWSAFSRSAMCDIDWIRRGRNGGCRYWVARACRRIGCGARRNLHLRGGSRCLWLVMFVPRFPQQHAAKHKNNQRNDSLGIHSGLS